MHAHHVRGAEQLVEGETGAFDGDGLASHLDVHVAVRHERVVGHHVHAAAQGVRRERTADAAKAHDAERLAAQLGAFSVGLLQGFELAGATGGHLAVAVVLEARQGEQVPHDQFRHALGRGRRRVEDGDAVVPGVFDVDVVHPDASASDEFQVGAGVNERLAHFGGRPNGDTVNGVLVDERFELVGFDEVGEEGVSGVAERLRSGRADAVVGEDVHVVKLGIRGRNSLALRAFKFTHHVDQNLHALQREGVVHGGTVAAHAAVALQAADVRTVPLRVEGCRVAVVVQAERHVHVRTASFLRVPHEERVAVDFGVEVGFGLVLLLNGRHTALFLQPTQREQRREHREHRRGVEHAVLVEVALEGRGRRDVAPGLAETLRVHGVHHCTCRPHVFLDASVNERERLRVKRAAQDVRAHVRHQGHVALGHLRILRPKIVLFVVMCR